MSTERLETLMEQVLELLSEKFIETNNILTEIQDELSEIHDELNCWADETTAVGHLASQLGEIKSAVKQVGLETESIYAHMLTKK